MPIRPIQAANDVFARAERLASHATRVKDPLIADDMRRSALALGVAALDTYLHWAIADAPLGGTLPTALANLEVPFGDMVDLSEEVV